MTTEVFFISVVETYTIYAQTMFAYAQAFSASVHWNIIDSYAPNSGRYKGDPIADLHWTSPYSLDLSGNTVSGAWIVIEATGSLISGTPPMAQCLIVAQSALTGYVDPSGHDYGYSGGTDGQNILYRFAPYGGWDLDDTAPDFVGPGSEPSLRTALLRMATGGTSLYPVFCFDVGGLACFTRYHEDNTGAPYALGGYIGDYIPIYDTVDLLPRLLYGCSGGAMVVTDLNQWESVQTNGVIRLFSPSKEELYGSGSFTPFQDYGSPIYSKVVNRMTQPFRFGAQNAYDLWPFAPILKPTSDGRPNTLFGSIPMLRVGYLPGPVKMGGGEWYSLTWGYGPAIKWNDAYDLRSS